MTLQKYKIVLYDGSTYEKFNAERCLFDRELNAFLFIKDDDIRLFLPRESLQMLFGLVECKHPAYPAQYAPIN